MAFGIKYSCGSTGLSMAIKWWIAQECCHWCLMSLAKLYGTCSCNFFAWVKAQKMWWHMQICMLVLMKDTSTVDPLLACFKWPLSTEATLSNVAADFWRYYYECIYFSLLPKATSLMWPQFLGKWGGLIRGGLLYWYFIILSTGILLYFIKSVL